MTYGSTSRELPVANYKPRTTASAVVFLTPQQRALINFQRLLLRTSQADHVLITSAIFNNDLKHRGTKEVGRRRAAAQCCRNLTLMRLPSAACRELPAAWSPPLLWLAPPTCRVAVMRPVPPTEALATRG